MVTAPLGTLEFEHLRIKVSRYTSVTGKPWGLGQNADRAAAIEVVDVDAL
jgi:hypothetical protein